MSDEDLHVAVVGAGACGLLIAQGPKKNGIRVSVYECLSKEAYETNPRIWTMALHWSRNNVERSLPENIYKDMTSTYTNPWQEPSPEEAAALPIVDGKTGASLVKVKVDDARRVVRGRLRDLFRREIDVHYGFKLTKVEAKDKVYTTFENGDTIQADVLSGSLNSLFFLPLKSAVRDHLINDASKPLTQMPLISTNIGCQYTAEQALFLRSKIHPIATMAIHPDQETFFFLAIADVPDPDRPETWKFQVALSLWSGENPPQSNEDRTRLFKKLAEPHCEPYRSAVLWVPDDLNISLDRYAPWTKIEPWENFGGRVTLAGYAAHPMCPFRGQGLNNALQDAGMFVNAMVEVKNGGQDLASAVRAYDHEVYTRGKNEIEVSGESMYGLHHYEVMKGSPINRYGLKKQ